MTSARLHSTSGPAVGLALRAGGLALLWWLLTGRDGASWVVGGPAVVAGVWISHRLSPAGGVRLRWRALPRYGWFFVWHSLSGGVDVAWRALHPRLPLAAHLEEYPLRLPAAGPARVVFANSMNLMPGTLCAELHAGHLTVHLLTASPQVRQQLVELEDAVAALFDLQLEPPAAR